MKSSRHKSLKQAIVEAAKVKQRKQIKLERKQDRKAINQLIIRQRDSAS